MKGCKDGEPRDERRLNSVIILDISGSMDGKLSKKSNKKRLDLSKEAIKMFVSKLRPDDSFGLVVFDTKGSTMIPCTQKKDLEVETVFSMIDTIRTKGGTTLSSGFNEGLRNLKEYTDKCVKDNCENRLIMLTDVGDNSLPTEEKFIQEVSQADIHVTIIGIS
jgi:Mg-chelatase subunit ChlD